MLPMFRDKPRSDANITGMLEPSTRIKVQSKTVTTSAFTL